MRPEFAHPIKGWRNPFKSRRSHWAALRGSANQLPGRALESQRSSLYARLMKKFLRDLWTRGILRGIHYRDRHSRFDQLYRIQDPWHMENESEQFRFEETNRLILKQIGPVHTLLEIGCGEGHQTAKLADLSNRLYAIDISGRAVERARQKCPGATFDVGDIFGAPILLATPRFDLVVACEVLYYMRDISSVLTRMGQLGRSCFVTYVDSERPQLASLLNRIPHLQTTIFEHNHIVWNAAWWSLDSDHEAGQAR